jgi:hypothetical protein
MNGVGGASSGDLLDNDREFLRRCNKFIGDNEFFFKNDDVGNDILKDIHGLNQGILDMDGADSTAEDFLGKLEVLYNNLVEGGEEIKARILDNFPEEYRADLDKFIEDILEERFDNSNINSRILINNINTGIKVVLCRMKNMRNEDSDVINNKIPQEWRLTSDKKTMYSTWLKNSEFSPYTFRPSRKVKKDKMRLFGNNSLYKYLEITSVNPDISKIYAKLYRDISGYINNLNELVGYSAESDTAFSSGYSYHIVRHVFLLVLLKLSETIQSEEDNINRIIEESEDIYPRFHINAETDTESPKITIISKLIFDLVFNIYLENNENETIGLYYNEELLSDKITKEREREKISVVDKLTNMDHEKRGVEIQMQEFGIKNIYKGKEAENLEWVQTDAYQAFRMAEREKLYGDASLLDPEAPEDIIGEMEMEAEAHVDRREATDNMEDVDADDGYDNADYADDELEA